MSYIVRQLTYSDLPSIASFMALPGWNVGDIARSMDNKFHLCYAALLPGSQPIGYLICSYLPCELDVHTCMEVLLFEVAPPMRSLGVGKSLLREAFLFAKANSVKRFFLEVQEDNIAAQNLYKLFGFKRNRVRRNYYVVQEKLYDAFEYVWVHDSMSSNS